MLASSLALLIPTVMAQNDGQVEDRVVVIEKESKIELPIANRNYEKISMLPVYPKPKPQEYSFEDIVIELPKANPKIKVPTINADPLNKLYGNYIKAGFGNYATSYLEAFVNSKRSDKFNYGFHYKHLASATGPVKSEVVKNFSRNSVNLLDGNLKYFAGKTTINAALGISRTRVNYYGLNPKILDTLSSNNIIPKDNFKQVYNIFSLGADLENSDKKEVLDYKIGFKYYNFADRFRASENEFLLQGSGNYELGKLDGIEMSTLFSTSKRKDSSEIGRMFFIVKPKYVFTKGMFDVKVGANIAYNNDSIKAYDKLHFYPTIHTDIRLYGKLLTAFVGLDGELQKNTLRTFVQENPFLGNNAMLYNTNKAFEFYGGGKGVLGEKVDYFLKLSYANYKNLYFYNNSFADTSRFNIFYAQGNTSVVNFNAKLSYEVASQLTVGIDANFTGYSVSNKDSLKLSAWHRPTSQINIYSTYNLKNKIFFNVNFYYIGGIKARNFISKKEDVTLDAALDLSLKTEYKVSNSFSGFLEINNIIGKKYQLLQYYPSKGINLLLGLTYSF